MTPEERARDVLLECTEEDDHDPPPCPKCTRIHDQIVAVLRAAIAEEREACATVVEGYHFLHSAIAAAIRAQT